MNASESIHSWWVLNFEVLTTLLEVEAMLNSRPLSYVYSDASEVRLGETHFYSAKDYTFPISDDQRKLGGHWSRTKYG